MCTFNGERFLPEQLASIAAQSRLPDELVVCDDGSTDRTLALLEEFRASVKFAVRIVRNDKNLGRTKNFEKVVSMCEHELIALTDFDDAWYPNKLEVLATTLESQPQAGYAFSDADLIDESGKVLKGNLYSRSGMRFWLKIGFPPDQQVRMLLKENVVTGAAMMMRASLRECVLPISGYAVQDHWIAAMASFVGDYGIAVFERLMKYRVHPKQVSGLYEPSKAVPDMLGAPAMWAEHLGTFRDLRETVHARPELLQKCKPADLLMLDEKIAHLEARLALHGAPLLRRYKAAFSEIRTGRYERFSLGWPSALRDLVPFLD